MGADPHRAAAVRDAAAIFAAFRPPPGARRSAGLPAGASAELASPPESPSGQLIDDGGWWVVRAAPQPVLAWVRRHPPAGFYDGGDGTASHSGVATAWWQVFARSPVPGVLDERQLLVEVGPAAGGRTAIRVDAQVVWRSSKQPSAQVPAAARVVTAIAGGAGKLVGGPVTVADPAQVRRIAAAVDRLPVAPSGAFSCPASSGQSVSLVFRARLGGPVLAEVVAQAGGCGGVTLTVRGVRQQPLSGGPGLIQRVESILGVRWKGLRSFPPG